MFTFLLTSDLLEPYQLEVDPIGWDAMRVAGVRDLKYHGITFSVTSELTFEKKAATYIRKVYEAQGIEGLVRLTIFERNQNEFRNEAIFSGRLDLVQYSTDARGVTVPLQETGFTNKFLNSDGLDVDLLKNVSQGGVTIPVPSLKTVDLFSQPIVKRYDVTVTAEHIRSGSNFVSSANVDSRFQTLYFGVGPVKTGPKETDVDDFGLGALASGPVTIPAGAPEAGPAFTAKEIGAYALDFSFQTDLFIKQGGSISLPVEFDIRFHKADATYYLRVANHAPIQLAQFSVTNQQTDLKRTVNLAHSGSYYLQPGAQVYIYAVLHVYDIDANPVSGDYSFEVYQDIKRGSFFRLQAATTTDATTVGGLLAYEAFAQCVQSITDAPGAFYSDYFGRTDTTPAYAVDGPGSLRLIASSWRVRNFPLSEKPFFATFRELYDSLDATDCLGCGIELRDGRQVLRIEDRAHFYQPVEVVKLLSVEGLKKSAAGDRFYNALEVGYRKWSSSSTNGLREVNGLRRFSLPLTQAPANTYSAVSPYVAAGFLLEETRRDQYQATSGQESRGDGDTYLICLRRQNAGFVAERNEAFSLVEGVLTPEATYNLRLTPGRNLRRHGSWLRSGLLKQTNRNLTRGEVEGSDLVTTQLAGETAVREDIDVPVSSLGTALYQPEIYECTATLRPSELQRLCAQPYGLVSIPNGSGPRLRGFVLRLEVTPRTHQCTLQLLRYD